MRCHTRVLGQQKHERNFSIRDRTAVFDSADNDRNDCNEGLVGQVDSSKNPESITQSSMGQMVLSDRLSCMGQQTLVECCLSERDRGRRLFGLV